MEYTERLATFLAEQPVKSIPAEVIDQTKLMILDTIGCGLGGYTLSGKEVKWTLDLVKSQQCQGPSRIICSGLKSSSCLAALANGAIIHTVDFDDTHMGSVSHLGASLVASSFALGEQLESSGLDVIAAIIFGFEAGARVGRSVMPSHYRFWHPTSTFGGIASAVAAARLLKLNAIQMEMVIGHAADMAGGLRYCIEHGDFSKSLHPGFAAMKGILAAQVISAGADGPRGLLEYPAGFCKAYSTDPQFKFLTASLGESYEIMNDSTKSFPTIHCSHTAVWSALDLIKTHDLSPDDMEKVEIVHTATVPGQGCSRSPQTPLAARLSIPYCIAVAAHERKVGLDQFSWERLKDPKIKDFMQRVSITASEEFRTKYPETLAGFVDIQLKNGKVVSAAQIFPKGDPRNRMTAAEVEEKFRMLAEKTFTQKRVDAIISAARELEKEPKISRFIDRLILE